MFVHFFFAVVGRQGFQVEAHHVLFASRKFLAVGIERPVGRMFLDAILPDHLERVAHDVWLVVLIHHFVDR